jgi:hypothetical protein
MNAFVNSPMAPALTKEPAGQFLAGVMGGNFPQAGEGARGIGNGTLFRIDPRCGRRGGDALDDRCPMAKGLGSHLYLVNFAHSRLKHLLEILCGGRVLGFKFVNHGEGSLFCEFLSTSPQL